MGTTLTALQTGTATIQWVAAIEGFTYLVTDGDAAAAVTAWAATSEFTSAISGLTVMGDWEQRLDPWDAFPDSGTVRLCIQPDENDRTAPMFKNAPRAEDSYLAADIDANDTTITVEDTSGLTSPVYIGTERITFSGSTATTLTGCTRGRKSPFSTSAGTFTFGRQHRSTTSDQETLLRPIVGDAPRVWVGKLVGLWAHRVVSGVLDVQAQAHLAFAGRIASIVDDAATGCTVVELESIADVVGETTVGRDAWRANVAEGMVLTESDQIRWSDFDSATARSATPLRVVTGAAATYEIEPGRYSAAELCSKINAWLAAEKAAARVGFNVSMSSPVAVDNGWRTVAKVEVNATALGTDTVTYRLQATPRVCKLLGFTDAEGDAVLNAIEYSGAPPSTGTVTNVSIAAPVKYSMDTFDIELSDEVGTFVDQRTDLPADAFATGIPSSGTWGVMACGDYLFAGEYSAGALTSVAVLRSFSPDGGATEGAIVGLTINRTISYDSDAPLSLRQVFVISGEWATVVAKLFTSTGTAGYNHATYDAYPASVGLAVPWSLLGDDFVDSLGALESADAPATLIIDKPTKLSDLIGADLLLRRAGLIFKNGTLRFARWGTPAAIVTAAATLTEANKATPAGSDNTERSPTRIDASQQRATVKLLFNRRGVNTDTYRDTITLQDRAAVDDGGGDARVATLKLRNNFARVGAVDESVMRDLSQAYLATMPLFSRPARIITRSISPDLFEGLAPGDVVDVSDNFARNPDTGARGLVAYRGIIIRHRYDWGGAEPGDPSSVRDMVGEVDVMLVEDDRSRPYCPAAQVDSTASGGGFSAGYNNGTLTLRLANYEHNESALLVTDPSWFQANDAIRIIEIDPTSPSGALSWQRTISSISGTDLVVSSGLSGWDSAKKYRVIPDDYATATRFQSCAYQADEADSRILDTTRAHSYASTAQYGRTNPTDTELPERYSSADIGDGKPYHVGQDRAICRGLNNLRRSMGRNQAPTFLNSFHQVDEATNWDMLSMRIFRVRKGRVARDINMTARWRSATGASSSLRITVSRMPPRSPAAADADDSVTYVEPYVQSSTFTTSSTTYGTSTFAVDASVADADGVCFITVEGKAAAQFSGFQLLGESVSGGQIREKWWCRNGHAPQAEFITRALTRLRDTYRTDTKLIFSHGATYAWPTSSLSSRNRWRFAFHTGTYTARIAIAWLIAPSTLTTTDSYATFRLTDVAAATDTDKVVYVGPVESAKTTLLPIGDCWYGLVYMDVDGSKDYEARISEYGGARNVAMAVWEVPSSAPLGTPLVSVGTPILDGDRTYLLGAITDALAHNGPQICNWTVDIGSAGRSTTSTTAKNIFDDSSTSVSSTTPGVVPQISNCQTLSMTGVPVVFKVYGSKTGAGNGEVTIKNSAGTILMTCTITTTSDAWTTVTGTLTSSDSAKYDVHYRVTAGATTLEVKHFSLYVKT